MSLTSKVANSGRYLFLSVSLILSLSARTAYSAPPVKGDTHYSLLPGQAPMLPGAGGLGLEGNGASGIATNYTLESAGLESAGLNPFTVENNGDTWLDGYWILVFKPYNADQVHGTNGTLPAPEPVGQVDGTGSVFTAPMLVDQTLQEMEPSDALQAILESPDSYTLIDLYYVIWLFARDHDEQSLMGVLCNYASVLRLYLDYDEIDFRQMSGDLPEREVLLESLTHLKQALRQPDFSREVAGKLTEFVFVALYDFVYAKAVSAFHQELYNGPQAGHILTFLYALDHISSELLNGENRIVPNNLTFARRMAWIAIASEVGGSQRSPELNRKLYYTHVSLTALYTLFIGQPDAAFKILEDLARSESAFASGSYTPEVDSIIDWVVNGNLNMYDQPEYDMIAKILSFMAKNAFPHHPPHTIVLAGDLNVLRTLWISLTTACRTQTVFSNLSPVLSAQIIKRASFDSDVLPPIVKMQDMVRRAQAIEEHKPLSNNRNRGLGCWQWFWKKKDHHF